jgi:hypothetical protein
MDGIKESPAALRAELGRALEGGGAVTTSERKRTTDDEVLEFIRRALAENPKSGHTKLLRALRADGRACEQSRFRRLFREVKGQVP